MEVSMMKHGRKKAADARDDQQERAQRIFDGKLREEQERTLRQIRNDCQLRVKKRKICKESRMHI
jgi:hypothetical protein